MVVTIVIDGEQFLISPRRVEHLVEFLTIVQMQYESQYRWVKSISVNGLLMPEVSEQHIRRMWESKKSLRVEINTVHQSENIGPVIEETQQYLTKLIYGVNMCAEHFHCNALDQAENYWTYCLEGIDWVVKKLKEIENALSVGDPSLGSPTRGGNRDQHAVYDGIGQAVQNLFELYHQRAFRQMAVVLETDLSNSLAQCQQFLTTLSKKAA